MRLFQNSGCYPSYLPRLQNLSIKDKSFEEQIKTFLADRFGACHFLKPVLDQESTAFFTNGDNEKLQKSWAHEKGMASNSSLREILLAQIENHQTEVFYNLDPIRYQNDFLKDLPGCVKVSIAWRAAPSPHANFGDYDAVVCNFPSILEGYRSRGWRAEYFSPAHDPQMDVYAANQVRPIDVLFVGGYSRHHRQRAAILEAVSGLKENYNIVFCLDRSRLTRLAESPFGFALPLKSARRPKNIRLVSDEPVFGRELYAQISRAKIVLNGAVDMAGLDRGNMRCFESMGCGALMVSDQGIYPQGMVDNVTMLLYSGAGEAKSTIEKALREFKKFADIAQASTEMIRANYGKAQQLENFMALVSKIG